MFWVGRLNAFIAILSFVGVVVVWSYAGVSDALVWLFAMAVLRVALRIVNTVWTAVVGNPLFYDIKVLDPGDE